MCLEIVLKGTLKVESSIVILDSATLPDNRRSLIRVAIIIHLLMNSELGLQHDNFTASLSPDACFHAGAAVFQPVQAVCEDPAAAPKPE